MKKEPLLSYEERKTYKELEIEQQDERNIALANAAKARAYELMLWLYAITILLLRALDRLSIGAFFSLLGVLAICQVYFIIRLKKYQEEQ